MGKGSRSGGRILDFGMSLLLAAMALYGAVLIVRSVWVPLCIGLAVVGLTAAVGWLVAGRRRRW